VVHMSIKAAGMGKRAIWSGNDVMLIINRWTCASPAFVVMGERGM
jgi:hypothetical protein